MRVAFLIRGDLDGVSGGFLYDRKIVEYLRAQGHEVQVLSFPWRIFFGGLGLKGISSLFHRLAVLSADIVLQDELAHAFLFFLNPRLKERLHIPLLAIVHHLKCCEEISPWRKSFHRFVERRYLKNLDGFICNSLATSRAVAHLAGSGKPEVVAYPGGDRLPGEGNGEALSLRSRADKVRIIFVGNIIPRKKIHTLLSSLSLMGGGDWELVVAGNCRADPAYARKVRRQVLTAGLQDQVEFVGRVTDGQLTDLLSRSHLLAVPSSYEGFGIVYLEAMSFGLPVIASSEGGAREMVTHGSNGFLVKPGDTRAIADHLRELIGNRDRLLTMGLAARERFHTFPTWEESCENVYRFLHRF